MLCVVIKGPTLEEAKEQISKANLSADLLEFRLDLINPLNEETIKKLQESTTLPVLFTLRKKEQGGNWLDSEQEREQQIVNFAGLNPQYIDLEYDSSPGLLSRIQAEHPNIKLIISYHDLKDTPKDLSKIEALIPKVPGAQTKIATWCNTSLDALRLLKFSKEKAGLIGMGMGEPGDLTRVLAPVVGSKITYASSESSSATVSGQLPAQILEKTYHHPMLSLTTQIYCLIGDPVTKSISEITHNALFQQCNINAVYTKIKLEPKEIKEFLSLAKSLAFKGVSVTMPLKEAVIPFLDAIDPSAEAIGAVNTLLFENNQIKGFNTDGIGALDAIEESTPVIGKKILLIGTGGAAKALAYEAKRRGAEVIILSRESAKAEAFAKKFGCQAGTLNAIGTIVKDGYDIIVNCTPNPMPIDPQWLKYGSYAMDLTSNVMDTPFLNEAKNRGAMPIYGYLMFVNQAVGQFKIWFKDTISQDLAKLVLRRSAESIFYPTVPKENDDLESEDDLETL